MAQRIEFTDEFMGHLDPQQQQKARDFVTNFKVETERIENMFEAKWYGSDNQDVVQIMREIQETLLDEQRAGNNQEQNTRRGTNQAKKSNRSQPN